MGYLTTHVLDTSNGVPGAGITIDLYSRSNAVHLHKTVRTNTDGRVDSPLLEGKEFTIGNWEMVFHIGEYFTKQGQQLPKPMFLDEVVIRFGITDTHAHYHVPLLVSPWSYSTYRGS